MMSYLQTQDLCRKTAGKIWHRKPVPEAHDGLLIHITHGMSSALSGAARNVRFLHADYDTTGDRFIAGDHQGNMFLFDLSKNRFSLVKRTGTPCTALSFKMKRNSEYLVAMSDYSLKSYDIDTKELVAWMKGHDSAIHSISVHESGRYALTTSTDTAQLWDLESFESKRKLNIKENVAVSKVFFLPHSHTIITCFKDDSIFAWESDTLVCKYQLTIPPGDRARYKDFATTRDGLLLAAAGKSRFIHLWSLDTHTLLRIIELPSKVTSVRQIEFLADSFDARSNQILGVLCQDGIMRFIHIHSCKLLFDIGSLDQRIASIAMAPNGRYMTAILEDGNLSVYNAQVLSAEIHKPPPPLVSVVTSNKTAGNLSTTLNSTSASHRKSAVRARGDKENRSQESHISDDQNNPLSGVTIDRLLSILKHYGEYPAKYRMFIWRSMLKLPENHTAYAALIDKGTHPSFSKLHEQYPVKSRKLLRILQRLLSAFTHWSPIFGETPFLPELCFPFVKLLQNNHLVCFEIIATVIVNWCQHWFEYFPNPPINVLSMIENVLAHHDKDLLNHFVHYRVTSQVYAWPLLSTLLSEVFTKEEWMKVWDNVFSNHPAFLLMVVVAYAICARAPLLQCSEVDDFKYFFHHQNSVDVRQVITKAYWLFDATPDAIHPKKSLQEFSPLTQGQYPVFNKYPKFIVDYQVQERERIRKEEMEYLRQRQSSLAWEKETISRQHEEEAWYRQQQLLNDAEAKRRRMIQEEEDKLGEQRKRLAAMQREGKLKELQLMDATRRKFLHFHRQQRETEIQRLEDEVERKTGQRELETEQAIEDMQIKNMELQLQKKMFEQDLFREYSEASRQLKSDYDFTRRKDELEERFPANVQDATEPDFVQENRKYLHQTLATANQKNIEAQAQADLMTSQLNAQTKQHHQQQRLSNLVWDNKQLENEITQLMKDCEVKQSTDVDHVQRSSAQCQKLIENNNAVAARTDVSSYEVGHRSTDSANNTVSLERRRRRSFDERQTQYMNEVRQLRERLAKENRQNKSPSPFSPH